jgi:hypothetical protein
MTPSNTLSAIMVAPAWLIYIRHVFAMQAIQPGPLQSASIYGNQCPSRNYRRPPKMATVPGSACARQSFS